MVYMLCLHGFVPFLNSNNKTTNITGGGGGGVGGNSPVLRHALISISNLLLIWNWDLSSELWFLHFECTSVCKILYFFK